MIKFKSFITRSTMFYSDLVKPKSIIKRNSLVDPTTSKPYMLFRSSYLSESYENLFLYPREAISQSLLLDPGQYTISCSGGSIEIFEKGIAVAGTPFLLELENQEEIFFIMSNDCYRPSIYEGRIKHPYNDSIRMENTLTFPKSIWQERELSYLQKISILPLSVEYVFVDGEEVPFEDSTFFVGWSDESKKIPFVLTDDNELFLEDQNGILGWYDLFQGAVLISYIKSPNLGSFNSDDLFPIASFYKDSDNYLAVNFRQDNWIFLMGKINGVSIEENLGYIEESKEKLYFFLGDSHVYIHTQNRLYDFFYEDLFKFEKLYVGFDGFNNYYNNIVEGVVI